MDWPEITKDTPLEEVKRIHQLIWDYVIERGYKPITPYDSNCVACEYVYQRMGDEDYECKQCPIAWKDGLTCRRRESIYNYWHLTRCQQLVARAKAYAKQIRDMPFKYELEVDEDA